MNKYMYELHVENKFQNTTHYLKLWMCVCEWMCLLERWRVRARFQAHIYLVQVCINLNTYTHREIFLWTLFPLKPVSPQAKREFKSQHKIYEPAKRICEWSGHTVHGIVLYI